MVTRRTFLAAGAAIPAATNKPVREKPLRPDYWGTSYYDEKERQELVEVLETRRPFRWYGSGSEPPKKVLTFEKEFAARMQVRHALAVSSGTAAINSALAALGVGPGDEVIVPAWTWHSCYNAVVLAGALPVFAEIDDSFNIDPADFEKKITPHTKVVMAVHLLGNPCDMDRILAVARQHRVKVMEDCAQSVGASYKGRPLGSMGDIGIYSLQLNKTITAGEGGAVVTNDPLLFERASRFHDLGGLRAPHQQAAGQARVEWFPGQNYRLNEFSGGVLLAQLRKLDRIVEDVRANARRVYAGIQDLPGLRLRRRSDPEGELGAAVFVGFDTKAQRDRFLGAMKAENVPAQPPGGSVILPTQPHIEKKVTVHPAWPSFTSERGRAIQYGKECCPKTIDILGRFAGVSLHPKYTRQDTEDIVTALRRAYAEVS